MIILFWTSYILIIYSYMVYPVLLRVLDKLFKPKAFVQTDDLPMVSLIVSAFNEEKVIRQRIENCFSLDYPEGHLEVLIASDGSDDKTAEIVKEYEGRGIILLDYKEREGKVNVLNKTVPKASHDILIFTDANTMFKHDAIKKLVRHFGDSKIGCVCGSLQFVNAKGSQTGELEGFYWRYETMMKKLEGKRGALLGANGAIYAIRKSLYENCPSDTIVEDFYLPMRILHKGYHVIYDVDANALEESAHKVIHEKERRIRIGAGDFQALFRLLPMLNPFKGFSALAFWSHKVLRWFAPILLLIVFASNSYLYYIPFYKGMFLLQVVFYVFACFGQVLSWSGFHNKIFSLPYYFVSMNLALLLGLFRYLSRSQKSAWKRTER